MPGLINKYQAGLEVSIWAFIIGMVMFVVAACVMKGKQSDYDDEWSTLRKSLSIIGVAMAFMLLLIGVASYGTLLNLQHTPQVWALQQVAKSLP